MDVRIYAYHENRSLIQSLALMRSAIMWGKTERYSKYSYIQSWLDSQCKAGRYIGTGMNEDSVGAPSQ